MAVEVTADRRRALAGAAIAIDFTLPEAVPENLELKQRVFKELDEAVNQVVATESDIAYTQALIDKQRQGVQVHLIRDSVGTIGTPVAFFERMDERFAALRRHGLVPVPVMLWALTSRDKESPGETLDTPLAIELAAARVTVMPPRAFFAFGFAPARSSPSTTSSRPLADAAISAVAAN